MGGRVKTITIVRFAGPTMGSSNVQEAVRKVWEGKFQSSSCFVDWAEPTMWSIEARVDFEDGTRGVLITDGSHVAFQGHDGKSWFLRLLPAAQ